MSTYYDTDSDEQDYTTQNNINDLSTDSSENETLNNIQQNNNNADDITIMKKLVDLTVKYENDLKKINEMKKVITNKLKKAKEQLVPYMQKKDIDHINLNPQYGGGKIKYNKTKVYSSLSKKKMVELLNAYFKNEQETKKIIKFLYDNREFKYVNKIVKTKK
tara:strand:+ start:1765 stop:2250 length:486 start_codon:yes stop_codon:yes gene_type:complete